MNQNLLQHAIDIFKNLSFLGAFVGAAAGALVVRYRAKRQYDRKDFLDRLHVSLNMLADGQLKIRTILERPLGEVMLNDHVKTKVLAAARSATPEKPLLELSQNDATFVLNCVVNVTAEHFCSGFFREDVGRPNDATLYAIFLTCEPVGEVRQRKVRALLVRPEFLRDFPYRDAMPKLEREWHTDRVKTLRSAAELYIKRPELFSHLELCA